MGIDKGSVLEEAIKPVYILAGNDTYTKLKFEKTIYSKLKETYGSCDRVVVAADDLSDQEIRGEILTGSLFGSIKLVIVRAGESLLASSGFKGFLDEYYAQNSPPSITVIETVKSVKALKKVKPIKMEVPYENRLPGWIRGYLKDRKKRIADDAANYLVFLCGRDLHVITQELEKLMLAFPDKIEYSIEDVRTAAGSHKKEDIFGFLNALVNAEERKALSLLQNLLDYGTEPLKILSMLKWKLQQMIAAKAMILEGKRENEILELLKLNPRFFYKGFCRKLERFTLDKLREDYDYLQKTDFEIKTSAADGRLLIEKFTCRFLSG